MKIKSLLNQGIRNSSLPLQPNLVWVVNLKLIDRRIYISNAGVWGFFISDPSDFLGVSRHYYSTAFKLYSSSTAEVSS